MVKCTSFATTKEYYKSTTLLTCRNKVESQNEELYFIETAQTMLADSMLPVKFWNEVVAAACYTLNQVLTVKKHDITCYELLHCRKPNLKFLEPFGSPCTLLDPDGKFGSKVVE